MAARVLRWLFNVLMALLTVRRVEGIEIEDATLVYQARLRAEDLDGNAYLEMWLHLPDSGPYFSRGLNSVVTGTTDWTERETIFLLQKGQAPQRITLNLVINGHGTVWIDDIRLLKKPLL